MSLQSENPLIAGLTFRQGTVAPDTVIELYQAGKLDGNNLYVPCEVGDTDADVACIFLEARRPGDSTSVRVCSDFSRAVPFLSDGTDEFVAGSDWATLSTTVAGRFEPSAIGTGILRVVESVGAVADAVGLGMFVGSGGGAAPPSSETLQDAYDNGAAGPQTILQDATRLGIAVQPYVGQTADTFAAKDESGTTIFAISPAGNVSIVETGTATLRKDALGATPAEKLYLANETDATNAVRVQVSPSAVFKGSAWDIGGAAAKDIIIRAYLLPTVTSGLYGNEINGKLVVTYEDSDTAEALIMSLDKRGQLRGASGNDYSWIDLVNLAMTSTNATKSPALNCGVVRIIADTSVGARLEYDSKGLVVYRASGGDPVISYAIDSLLALGEGEALTIAGNTVTPTHTVHKVGAGLLKTLPAPNGIVTGIGGLVYRFIPTDAFTFDTSGNIGLVGTAVIGRTLDFTYSDIDNIFYPSYV